MKIDKGIPMPKRNTRNSRYPWKELEVGDSFFIPGSSNGYSTVTYANKVYAPKRFACRKDNAGVRIWRIE
jgi:hypothetical protein